MPFQRYCYVIRSCILLWICSLPDGANSICNSESFAGSCIANINDEECRTACADDSLSGGRCEQYKSITLCMCDGCPGSTGEILEDLQYLTRA